MIHIYLTKNDEDKNMHRFYQMYITPALFNEWSLVREWGRIGSPGTVRKNWFDTEEQAVAEGMRVLKSKLKKGYSTIIQK